MKMIDVLFKLAKDEIEINTFLYVLDESGNVTRKFIYDGEVFVDIEKPGFDGLELYYWIDTIFLNLNVALLEK